MKVRIKKTRNDHPMPQITEQQLNEVDIGSIVNLLTQYSVPDAVMLTQTIAAGGIAALAVAIPYIKDMLDNSGENKSESVKAIDKILQDAGMPIMGSGAYDIPAEKSLEDARKRLQAMKAARQES
jgi:hypothetical protein